MELKKALDQINNDETKKAKFYDDPKGQLEALGVDTSNLKIKKTTGTDTGVLRTTVCASIGGGVLVQGCVSVGE